ncbi:MAG: hypothetical protein R3190_09550 [Thermoanaerobaculia bacterium]|nr:hypothetical protein [Thermoanaerobaculia bacterium]
MSSGSATAETRDAALSPESSVERRQRLRLAARRGVELCRAGDWATGVEMLSRVAEVDADWEPGLAGSYLGYGLASVRGEVDEGLSYCWAAVRREVWEADNHLNLARTYLLRREKKLAVAAIELGLSIDPRHSGLQSLRKRLGIRRKPVLGFLPRGHSLNVALGRLRKKLSPAVPAKP